MTSEQSAGVRMTLMADILESVGDQGVNRPNDVTMVQSLLKTNGFKCGLVDGVCGDRTITAIRAFQSTFLKEPDGLIEPGRATWRRLASTTTIPASPGLLEWSGNSASWSHEKKLQSLHLDLRPKVTGVLSGLSERGFQPKIFYGWRSVAVQLEIVKKGNSHVKFSFHNVQHKDGTPNAHAADIVDSRWGWDRQAGLNGFWTALGEEAKKQNLYWGGDWSKPDWAHVQLVANGLLGLKKRESGL
jgi:hypothetical protein